MALAKGSVFVADVSGPQGPVGKWPELTLLLPSTNLDTLSPGAYSPTSVDAAETMGLPTANNGTLIVYSWDFAGTQQWIPATSRGNEIWQRVKVGSAWRGWTRVDADVQLMTASMHTDNLTDGRYVNNVAGNAISMGFPAANIGILVQASLGANIQQTWTPISLTPRIYVRSKVGVNWGAWAVITPGGDAPGPVESVASVERETRVAEFRSRYGGRYGTGGKVALSLVFDHGTDNFIAKVLPLLKKYGVPATIGLNSQMYNTAYQFYGTDATTSFASLQTAFINAGISVWNHGRLHRPNTEPPATEIIGGRNELQASLPKIPIDGWLHTGQYGDFNHGNSFAAYRDETVGAMIMNGHAVLTGDIQEPIKPLTGEMKPGFDGEWLDTGATPIANVKALIQRAHAAGGGGVMTRNHPQFTDEPGYITTAQLDEFIGWCAAERDAGRLIFMTGDLMNLADSGTTVRRSVIGEVTTGTASFQVIDHPLRKGGVMVLEAEVTGSGTAVMGVTGGGVSASRSIPVAADRTITLPFMIPLDATGTISVSVTGVTVSKMRVVAG